MEDQWQRVAFTGAQVTALDFAEACVRINAGLQHAGWPSDIGIFVTDDWIYPHTGAAISILIYFLPKASAMFASLLQEMNAEKCNPPLRFGLVLFGNETAWNLLDNR